MDNSSSSMQSWEALYRKAKSLESNLEKKLQAYSALAQKINANFLGDEENGLLESNDEQSLSTDIEKDLEELYDCIQSMRQINVHLQSNSQEAWIKRYYEIHFDYSTEFKNTSATVQRKRDSLELMHSSRSTSKGEQDTSVAKLLREKLSIAASMKSINEVISQAFDAKNSLTSQRTSLSNSTGGLTNISSSVPGISRIIDGIQKKKFRESLILTLVIAALVCFAIWWSFLR